MNVLGYLQRIGCALMVPVATLPAAAIMMGIGYWIDPVGWGAQSALAAFLIKAGAAIIDNMSVLFAIGVAYGIWGASGVALTAILSTLIYGEPLTPIMVGGIVLITLGVLTIELGSQRAARQRQAAS